MEGDAGLHFLLKVSQECLAKFTDSLISKKIKLTSVAEYYNRPSDQNQNMFVIHPYIRGIKKKNWKIEEGKWVNYGECSYDDKKKMIYITDLPYDMDFESFEKLLNKMIEKEEIKDWENYSNGEEKIEYRINVKKGKFLETLKGKDINKKIIAKFKLKTVVPEDLLYVLDENKKILHFHSPQELIEYFVDFPELIYYTKTILL